MPASTAPTTTYQGVGAPVLSSNQLNPGAQSLAPGNGGYTVAPQNAYGTQPFDPYSSVPAAGGLPPATLGAPYATPLTGPVGTFNQPAPYQQPGAGANPYATYPSQPPVLFPGGLLGSGSQTGGGIFAGGSKSG